MAAVTLFYILIPALISLIALRKYREYKWGWCSSKKSLTGKTFLITGANCGIGFETAKALALRDATVILACRDMQKAAAAISDILKFTKNGELISLELNLSDFESIRQFADIIKQQHPKLNCLINNAGISTNKLSKTAQNFESHFGVNHLGHFLLTNLLLETLKQNKSKIVIVTSTLHEKGHIDISQLKSDVILDDQTIAQREANKPKGRENPLYSNSKLANMYMAMELEKMGFETYAVCPGFTYTNIFRDYDIKWYQYLMFSPIAFLFLRSAEQGAQTVIQCAIENVKSPKDTVHTLQNGYFNRDCGFVKSKVVFDEQISKELWCISKELCKC